MSGGTMRITLATGEEYEVPEDRAMRVMQALDRKQVKFDAVKATGDMTVGEPEVIKSTQPPPDDDAPPLERWGRAISAQSQPAMDEFKSKVSGLGDTLGDAAASFNGGWTAKLDQSLPFGIGDAIREDRELAAKRSPVVSGAMDVAGAVASPINKVAGLAKGAPIAGQALSGFAQGAGRGYSDAPEDATLPEKAWAALAQGGRSAAAGGLLAGAAQGVSATSNAASRGLGSLSDKARVAAIGASGADLRKLADSRGLDYVENNVGREPERLGVTNAFFPQSASTYARKLGDRAQQADAQIGQSLDDAQSQGVGDIVRDRSRGAILDSLDERAGLAARANTGQSEATRGAFDRVRSDVAAREIETPVQLRALKSDLDRQAFPNALQGSSESLLGQANRGAGSAVRSELRDVMGYALPETEQAFAQGNRDYGSAATLGELAQARGATDYAGGGLLGNVGRGIAGAATGAMGGAAFGSPGTGAALGASYAMAQPAKALGAKYGADFGANLGRLGEGAFGSLGGKASALADNAGAIVASGPLEQLGARLSAKDLGDKTRGHLIPQAIQEALRSGQLGPYADKFARAATSSDANALGGLYQTLSTTDPVFRDKYRPIIMQLTAEGER